MTVVPLALSATSRRRVLVGAAGIVAVSAPGMLALARELLNGSSLAFLIA
jgi:hypothetical protein